LLPDRPKLRSVRARPLCERARRAARELVLAWNERHCPPLLETFAALCRQVALETAAAG